MGRGGGGGRKTERERERERGRERHWMQHYLYMSIMNTTVNHNIAVNKTKDYWKNKINYSNKYSYSLQKLVAKVESTHRHW